MSDIDRIRAFVTDDHASISVNSARALLAALDAERALRERAEVERDEARSDAT